MGDCRDELGVLQVEETMIEEEQDEEVDDSLLATQDHEEEGCLYFSPLSKNDSIVPASNVVKKTGPILEQDRYLPIANVSRIMKRMLPTTGKVAKEAKECIQECVSEFLSFITSEASDRCLMEKRKTITGEDLLQAIASLGFDAYLDTMKLYSERYKDATRVDKLSGPCTSSTVLPMATVGREEKLEKQQQQQQRVTEQIQTVQLTTGGPQNKPLIYVDVKTGQQYVSVHTGREGTAQLIPVQINDSLVDESQLHQIQISTQNSSDA